MPDSRTSSIRALFRPNSRSPLQPARSSTDGRPRQEMIDIVREETGKQYIIFIIDEVGQYVGRSEQPDPQPRGPGQEPQEARRRQGLDHRHRAADADRRRPARRAELAGALQAQGPLPDPDRPGIERHQGDLLPPAARQIAGWRDASSASSSSRTARRCATTPSCKTPSTTTPTSTRDSFINLYPFLPAHFDILLHLLGALAKSTGGIGLRSAIKVIQDILVKGLKAAPSRWPTSPSAGWPRPSRSTTRWRRTSGAPSLHPSGGRQGADPLPGLAAASGDRQDRRRPADPRQPAGDGRRTSPA